MISGKKKKIFGSTYYVISIFAGDMVPSKFFLNDDLDMYKI
jgi:hypothetical protein